MPANAARLLSSLDWPVAFDSALIKHSLSLTSSPAWRALQHCRRDAEARLDVRRLSGERHRFADYSLCAPGLRFDYSRHRLDADALRLLLELAQQQGVEEWRRRLFAGEAVNTTENRPALHPALRGQGPKAQAAEAAAELGRARSLVARLGRGGPGGSVGQVLHIGIGGSELGARLLAEALSPPSTRAEEGGIPIHFVSQPADVERQLQQLDIEQLLVVVASKSFSTGETIECSALVRRLMQQRLGGDRADQRLVAITANVDEARSQGFAEERILRLWPWVGGRFSFASVLALGLLLQPGGEEIFSELLRGAAALDSHFLEAPLAGNAPVVAALLNVWYLSFWGASGQAIVPYDSRLRSLPAWLAQLSMESCGKGVDRDGNSLDCATAGIVWGMAGSDAEHSFFQALHQGSMLAPCDLIVPAGPIGEGGDRTLSRALQARAVAQADVLALGDGLGTDRQTDPHRALAGNRPASLLLIEGGLSPFTLGCLLAFYEHRVFVEGVLWQLNPFDQWGVEKGKEVAPKHYARLAAFEQDPDSDRPGGALGWFGELALSPPAPDRGR